MEQWTDAMKQRVDEYLGAVRRAMGGKPEKVQVEIIRDLREHIEESVRLAEASGNPATLEMVERILAEMDEPESFGESDAIEMAENGGISPVLASKSAENGQNSSFLWKNRWFFVALAFLVVNIGGFWMLLRPEGQEMAFASCVVAPPDGEISAEDVESAVEVFLPELALKKVRQVDVSSEREVILRFDFNAEPDRGLVTRHLSFYDGNGEPVEYRLRPASDAVSVVVETAPVLTRTLVYQVASGLPAKNSAAYAPLSGSEFAEVTMQMNLWFDRMWAETPSFEEPYIKMWFNAALDYERAKEFISISPDVAFTVEAENSYSWASAQVRGDFTPGDVYEVTLKEGLPARNGASLAQTVVKRVSIPEPRADIRIDVPGRYLSPRGMLRVPVRAVNSSTFTARAAKVYPNNLITLALREMNGTYWENVTEFLIGEIHEQTYALPDAASGFMQEGSVDLADVLGDSPKGVYGLVVEGEKRGSDFRLLVVTDLGLSVRGFCGGAVVWVNSLQEATAVEGAAVTVYSHNNQVMARGVTDAHGVVTLSWALELEKFQEPFLVTAELGDDLSYVDFIRGQVPQEENLTPQHYFLSEGYEAFVFTDRGIYRPNETVFVQTLVRDGHMRTPTAFPVVLRIRRPDGKLFREVPLMLDVLGSACTEVELPDFLPTGRYDLELVMPGTHTKLGDTKVSLEEFVPPQIRVKLDVPEARLTLADPLEFSAVGEYLFGSPAAGLKASAHVTFMPVAFAPASWRGWTFGDSRKEFADKSQPVGIGSLDASGRGKFTTKPRLSWRPPAALKAMYSVTVTESAGGRAVTAYGSSLLDPYPFYIGLKPEWQGMIRVGEGQRLRVAEVLPDGTAVAEGKPLLMTLSRVTWSSALRRNPNGKYEWKSERHEEVVKEDTLVIQPDGSEWAFEVDVRGEYTVVAKDPASGASTRYEFYAGSVDASWSEWSRERPGRIELVWDKKRPYRSGETAVLQIRSPFAGPALLTIEQDRVLKTIPLMLEKNTAEIEIEVTDEFAPNAYVSLSVIRPAVAESVWSAHRALGILSLPVERAGRALTAAFDVPEEIRPKTTLSGSVRVTDEAGRPVSGAVTVMAVDEAICMLTAFESPDPLRHFNAARALAVWLYDLYNDLMPIRDNQVVSTPVAGGDAAAKVRKRLNPIKANRFKPLALWQAKLELDEDGRAAFSMDVPEFTGELRLMAVAYNAEQLGSKAVPVKVKRDLIVYPSLPRFLSINDACSMMVPVFNESKEAMTVQVRVTCGGPLSTDSPEHTFELAAGESTRLSIPLTAGAIPGKALCTIDVSGGSEHYNETVEIAIRPAGGLRVSSTNLVLKAGQSATLAAPGDWLAQSVHASGVMSSLASLQMARALEYVVYYPYGCLEQTVSGAFPLLRAKDLMARLLPTERALGDTDATVNAAIRRVLSMQLDSGAFAMWPQSRETAREASLYAIHFLLEAKAAGFSVPSGNLDSALAWLRSRLNTGLPSGGDKPEIQLKMEELAYINYLLALTGTPDAGWISRLRDNTETLGYAARVYLAATYLLTGEPREAMPLLTSLPLPVTRDRIPGYLLNSDIRDAALLLSTWLDIDAENPAVAHLAQYLSSQQDDGQWGNTHDNAMALLALGKMAQHLPAEEQPFSAAVDSAAGRISAVNTNQASWSFAADDGVPSVTLRNDGPGSMYVWATFEGVANTPEPAVTNGISIAREYVDLKNKPIDPGLLPQGELFIVKLHINPLDRRLDQLIIEDLLPAGWEIENPNLRTSQQIDWLPSRPEGDLSREARDDRMLIFTGIVDHPVTYRYAVRAVTPGAFIHPPATVSGMYAPDIRGVSPAGAVSVLPAEYSGGLR